MRIARETTDLKDLMHFPRHLLALACAIALLSGCQAPLPTPPSPAVSTAGSTVPDRATPTPTPTLSPTARPTPTPRVSTPSASSTPSPTDPTPDTRKGKALATPYRVNGIAVISKDHRISRAYRPANPGAHGLEKPVATALAAMTRAARKDGVKLVVRSGYRSYATQASIYQRQLARYPSKELARRYNAPAGASEHQSGLSVDLWDGRTWGVGMARTQAGKWLWKHAREYGFILRYPPDGKEKITGYAYEPWHFRYLGTEHSLKFKANSTVTLEEYLGLD